MAYTEEELKKELEQQEYQYGFTTKIESETFPVGLNEDIVRSISKKKNEHKWMTNWRLDDLYARQHKLTAIGQATQNNEAAIFAAEEARNKRHREAEQKRVDDKEDV